MESHIDKEHSRKEPQGVKCKEIACDFNSTSESDMESHVNTEHSTNESQDSKYEQCDFVSASSADLKLHVDVNHSRSLQCNECDFTSTTQSELDKHMKEKKRTQPNCTKCSVAEGEITVLKAKVDSLSEVEENYDVARRMYVEKEKELQKSNELHSKDLEKEGLGRLKLEDTVSLNASISF